MCGTASNEDGRKFIDFLFHLDWYGRIYFCSECFAEASAALGFIPRLAEETTREELNKIDDLYVNLSVRFDTLQRVLGEQLSNCSCHASDNGSDGNVDAGLHDAQDVSIDSEPAESDPEVDEPSSVKGSGSVRKSASAK